MIAASMSAFAADGDPAPAPAATAAAPTPEGNSADGSVTISGLDQGDEVSLYKVIEWGWINNNTTGGWKLTEAFAANETLQALVSNINKAVATPYTLTEADVNAITAVVVAEGFAGNAITGGTVNTDGVSTTNVDPGMYIAFVAPAVAGTLYNPIVVSADYDDDNGTNEIGSLLTETVGASAKAKKQNITLLKTTSDSDSAVATAIDSYIGQEVTFYVDTTIPVYLSTYTKAAFAVDDTIMTNGIELVPNSIKVKLGDAAESSEYTTDNYTVAEKSDKKGYTVTFEEAYLKQNRSTVALHIEYKGKITNTAEFNINEDSNEVKVTYTNGPKDEAAALKDQTNHYTFSLGAKAFGQSDASGKTYELVKVGVDAEGNPVVDEKTIAEWHEEVKRHPLAGATFALYTDEACTQLYNPTGFAGENTFITGNDGIITFKGLSAGTYYIKETSAPSGYVKDDRAAKVEIVAHYTNVPVAATTETVGEKTIEVAGYEVEVLDWYEVKVNNVSIYQSEKYAKTDSIVDTKYEYDNDGGHITDIKPASNINDSELVNTKGVELPSTGGMGTTILYVGGSILVILAAVLLITKRRMSADE